MTQTRRFFLVAATVTAAQCLFFISYTRYHAQWKAKDGVAMGFGVTDAELRSQRIGSAVLVPKIFTNSTEIIRDRTPDTSRWPSQVGQDAFVLGMMTYEGINIRSSAEHPLFYLDIAANMPFALSNTYALDRWLGWNGICWEAHPSYWWPLATRRTCTIIGAAVFNESHRVLWLAEPAEHRPQSALVAEGTDYRKESFGENARFTPVSTLTMNDAFAALPNVVPQHVIDYFSLDVEGAEWYAMQTYDFSRHFRALSVERPQPPLVKRLLEQGYYQVGSLVKFSDLIFIHPKLMPKTAALVQRLERAHFGGDHRVYRFHKDEREATFCEQLKDTFALDRRYKSPRAMLAALESGSLAAGANAWVERAL